MSRFRERCGELRARVLVVGSVRELARERDMPTTANLQKHVNDECTCDAAIPPLSYVGSGAGGEWTLSGDPPCPHCETDLLVERSATEDARKIQCHGCGYEADPQQYARAWLRSQGHTPDRGRMEVDA